MPVLLPACLPALGTVPGVPWVLCPECPGCLDPQSPLYPCCPQDPPREHHRGGRMRARPVKLARARPARMYSSWWLTCARWGLGPLRGGHAPSFQPTYPMQDPPAWALPISAQGHYQHTTTPGGTQAPTRLKWASIISAVRGPVMGTAALASSSSGIWTLQAQHGVCLFFKVLDTRGPAGSAHKDGYTARAA